MDIQRAIQTLLAKINVASTAEDEADVICTFAVNVNNRLMSIMGLACGRSKDEDARYDSNAIAEAQTADETCKEDSTHLLDLGACDLYMRTQNRYGQMTIVQTIEFGPDGALLRSTEDPIGEEYLYIPLTCEQAAPFVVIHLAKQIGGVAQVSTPDEREQLLKIFEG